MTLRERYAEARLTPGAIRYDQSNWMSVLIEIGRRDRERMAAEPDGPVPVVCGRETAVDQPELGGENHRRQFRSTKR
jgi:hypothetical protein